MPLAGIDIVPVIFTEDGASIAWRPPMASMCLSTTARPSGSAAAGAGAWTDTAGAVVTAGDGPLAAQPGASPSAHRAEKPRPADTARPDRKVRSSFRAGLMPLEISQRKLCISPSMI